jgi:hypothetical protein
LELREVVIIGYGKVPVHALKSMSKSTGIPSVLEELHENAKCVGRGDEHAIDDRTEFNPCDVLELSTFKDIAVIFGGSRIPRLDFTHNHGGTP